MTGDNGIEGKIIPNVLFIMAKLSQHGGFSDEAIAKAKAAMAEGLDFSETPEPAKRNTSGYPSAGGFIEQHFNLKSKDI